MATSVLDLIKESQQLEKTKQRLFNPGTEDFVVVFQTKPYTLHAQEIEEFDYYVAEHIKKHLANYLMGKSQTRNPNEHDWNKIYKKIEVDLL